MGILGEEFVEKLKGDGLGETLFLDGIQVSRSEAHSILEEIGKYGLGLERTREDYEKWSGIDFRKKTLAERSKYGGLDKKYFQREFSDNQKQLLFELLNQYKEEKK